jgi:hypothetical protein
VVKHHSFGAGSCPRTVFLVRCVVTQSSGATHSSTFMQDPHAGSLVAHYAILRRHPHAGCTVAHFDGERASSVQAGSSASFVECAFVSNTLDYGVLRGVYEVYAGFPDTPGGSDTHFLWPGQDDDDDDGTLSVGCDLPSAHPTDTSHASTSSNGSLFSLGLESTDHKRMPDLMDNAPVSPTSSVVRLESCTISKNSVPHHALDTVATSWFGGHVPGDALASDYCDPNARVLYSNSKMEVWSSCESSTTATTPLEEVPPFPAVLTSNDHFITGLQQVCTGTAVCYYFERMQLMLT